MRIPHYLTVSRHQIYYFRFPIPRHLHPEYRASDVKLSLNTRSARQAMYIGQQLFYLGQQLINYPALANMDYSELKAQVQQYFSERLADTTGRMKREGPFNDQKRQLFQTSREMLLQHDEPFPPSDDAVNNFIDRHLLEIKPNENSYEQLRQLIGSFKADYLGKALEFDASLRTTTLDAQIVLAKTITTKPQIKIRTVFEQYIQEKLRDKGTTENSANDQKRHIDVLLEIIGEDHPLEIDFNTASLIKSTLQAKPANYSRKKGMKGLTIQQAIEQFPMAPKISGATVNAHLVTYSAFYNWMTERDFVIKNRFPSQMFAPKDSVEKLPFEDDAIRLIVETVTDEANPLLKRYKPFKKWGSLLAVYTGARSNEIASLLVKDVRQVGEVWCIDVNKEGANKRIKNESSKRTVPIHNQILELGFMDFYNSLPKEPSARLFSELPFSSRNGFGDQFSKWFSRLLEKLDLKTEQHTLHSLRHTLIRKLVRAEVDTNTAHSISGHKNEGVFWDYAHGHSVRQMKKALDLVSFY